MSGGGDMQCVSIVREEEGEWRGRQCASIVREEGEWRVSGGGDSVRT